MKMQMTALFILLEVLAPRAARAQSWGSGLYGGMQGCQAQQQMPMGQMQGGAQDNQESSEVTDLQDQLRDLRTQKRDAEKKVSELKKKKELYDEAINRRMSDDWASQVISHLESDDGCECDPSGGDDSSDGSSGSEHDSGPGRGGPPGDRPPMGAGHRVGRLNFSALRSPASESFGASAVPAANPYDVSWANSGGGLAPSGGRQCAASQMTQSKSWHAVCHHGGVSRLVCTNPHFASEGGEHSPSDCLEAIGNYRQVMRAMQKAKSAMNDIDSKTSELRQEIAVAKRDAKEGGGGRGDLDRGAGPGGGGPGGGGQSSASGWVNALAPLGVGLLGGLGAEYMGYKANQANNTNLTKLGYPTQSYTFGNYGFPFFQAGIYGSLAANSPSGFSCSSSMGGGGQTGASGMNGMGMMNGMNGMSYGSLNSFSMGANPFVNPYASSMAGSGSLLYRMNQINAGVSTYGR